MTFEELQAKAEEAKKVSEKVALLNSMKENPPVLRYSNGNYIDGLIGNEVVTAGLEVVINREMQKLEALLK